MPLYFHGGQSMNILHSHSNAFLMSFSTTHTPISISQSWLRHQSSSVRFTKLGPIKWIRRLSFFSVHLSSLKCNQRRRITYIVKFFLKHVSRATDEQLNKATSYGGNLKCHRNLPAVSATERRPDWSRHQCNELSWLMIFRDYFAVPPVWRLHVYRINVNNETYRPTVIVHMRISKWCGSPGWVNQCEHLWQ